MSDGQSQTGTIETRVPARLDRLPWSRFPWMVVIGLGRRRETEGERRTRPGAIVATRRRR
jgi:hypothetical protein